MTNYFTSLMIEENAGTGSFGGVVFNTVGYFKGFIQPISGAETFAKGKNGETATHRLYTEMSTPVKYGYRVLQNGVYYIMLYTIQPSGISGVGHHKEITMGLLQ